ncbi:hypothetical protein TVAG_425120 [Trichomonas vaginalis G3]|uniref:Polymorphic repeat outer membrane protein n=1 Tax=Trichomonas vaginalis (strain ATCC PRA-98 / G3) TaxID=412133 RepID=A2F5G2_TRIV3|nr:hypothetical protein TVAGG3_0636000 [Trichomonas vaginalis G3]EAX99875.1 hypothetical protein TVAG_425120 [Trichomonas vaginalis G3]KAI5504860.1 hypothetical protein TVAGG3_0636000 [Trichomonas vaginalis G3]|eukprot:XP_001312805.1 hypothetical protein [Trichomonas vaginalis G3]
MNGGAISLISYNIESEIQYSLFSECSSSLEGGAVYIKKLNTNFTNNIFRSCFSSLKSNDRYGNAIYNEESLSDLNESSFLSCGPDKNRRSDSCVFMKGNKFISMLNNGTNNYGSGGSGLVSFRSALTGTFVKFNQVYKCFDHYFIEIILCSYNATYSNYIDASEQQYIFYVGIGTANFENCIFLNLSGKTIENSQGSYKFTDCFSNDKTSFMSQSSFPTTHKIDIVIKDCNSKKSCSLIHRDLNFIHFSNLILYLSIHLIVE